MTFISTQTAQRVPVSEVLRFNVKIGSQKINMDISANELLGRVLPSCPQLQVTMTSLTPTHACEKCTHCCTDLTTFPHRSYLTQAHTQACKHKTDIKCIERAQQFTTRAVLKWATRMFQLKNTSKSLEYHSVLWSCNVLLKFSYHIDPNIYNTRSHHVQLRPIGLHVPVCSARS